MERCNVDGCDMDRRHVDGRHLDRCDMDGRHLERCHLDGRRLERCDVDRCDVDGCDVDGCDVDGCDVDGCDVDRCDVDECDVVDTLVELIPPSWRGAVARLGPKARVWAFTFGLALAAGVLATTVLNGHDRLVGETRMSFWALVLAFAVVESVVVHIQFRRESESFRSSRFRWFSVSCLPPRSNCSGPWRWGAPSRWLSCVVRLR